MCNVLGPILRLLHGYGGLFGEQNQSLTGTQLPSFLLMHCPSPVREHLPAAVQPKCQIIPLFLDFELYELGEHLVIPIPIIYRTAPSFVFPLSDHKGAYSLWFGLAFLVLRALSKMSGNTKIRKFITPLPSFEALLFRYGKKQCFSYLKGKNHHNFNTT